MPKFIPVLLTAPLALALGSCAQVDSEPEAQVAYDTSRQCFFTNNINGYSNAPDGPEGQDRLMVHTGVRDRWLFEVVGSCIELDFAQAIALDTGSRTSLCTGAVETLLVPTFGRDRPERCTVRLLGKVTPDPA